MAGYSQSFTRPDVGAKSPEDFIANAIIESLPQASLVLSAGARRVPVSKAQARFPVLSLLPEAYFVNGDTGLKQTTKAAWANRYINIEELAVIVPIPESVVEDADFDILSATQPLITEAIGYALDGAVLFGVNKPPSWDLGDGPTPNGLAHIAETRGHVYTATGHNYKDLIATMKLVAADGHPVTGFVADSLYEYELLGETDTLGRPLFTPSTNASGVAALLGRPFTYLNSGVWDDTYKTLMGDISSRLLVGMRRDFTFEVFREGVITDSSGAIVLNLMQQDSRALRVTMRIGVTVGNPIQRRSRNNPNAFPFAVLKA